MSDAPAVLYFGRAGCPRSDSALAYLEALGFRTQVAISQAAGVALPAWVHDWRGDWIFWGGFVVYSVISAYHQDARKAAAGPEAVREFLASTSRMPFGAVAAGRQPLRLGELKPLGLIIAVALFALLRAYHGAWFGGFGG